MKTTDRIFLAGHEGMVGAALMRALKGRGFTNIIVANKRELDLRDAQRVESFFRRERPDHVLLAAAKVGGIQANKQYPAEFIYDNLMIQNNVIHQSHVHGVKQLVFLGSSCIYPKECPQPMKEEYLLTGPLEPTNEAYAIAKITGLKMAQFYYQQYGLRSISPMPCNLYGPNDSFDLNHSHVLSALVRKFVDAASEGTLEVVIWGSGIARREFMHVDDLAAAVFLLIEKWDSPEIINVGWGVDISIKEMAEMIAAKVGYRGNLKWNTDMPDGMLRKCLDVSRIRALGFAPSITLNDGVDQVIQDYRQLRERVDVSV
jgi:GDP-L-fucose synthase